MTTVADADFDAEGRPAVGRASARRGPIRAARAELVVVGADAHALAEHLMQPDPKAAFARVQDQVRRDAGESAITVLDLMPLSRRDRARHRRKLLNDLRVGAPPGAPGGPGSWWGEFREGLGFRAATGGAAATGAPAGGAWMRQFTAGLGVKLPPGPGAGRNPGRGAAGPDDGDRTARSLERRQTALELARVDALFALQVLLRATSRIEGREIALLQMLLSCFEPFRGSSSFEPRGQVIGLGEWELAFLGADAWWRRRRFDRRFATGVFRPGGRSIVATSEIAALLVPATKWCDSENVVRSGGAVPNAPAALPTYRHQPHIMPLGTIVTARGRRLAGLYARDTRFWSFFGKTGSGKSEVESLQVLWSALHARWRKPPGMPGPSHIGSLTLDPHGQILERLPDYLHEVRDRLVVLDIATRKPERPVAAWNPLDMTGCDESDIEAKTKPLVDALALVNNWHSGKNSRAINLTQNALMALAQLGLHLPPDRQPTIFQLITLLTDDEWRDAVLEATDQHGRHIVHKPQRDYFADFFTRDQTGKVRPQPEATSAVTHTIYRLRASRPIAAMFGSSRSAFDLRRAMDTGQIVIACLNAASEMETQLIAAFLVFGLLRAAMSRIDLPEEQRRPFYGWLDEAHIYDDGTIADLLREARKLLRGGVCVLDQDPKALDEDTYRALSTNGSHLLTGVIGQEEAAWIAKQWGDVVVPATLMQLASDTERPDGTRLFEYVGRVTVDGKPTQPFKFEGAPVAEVFADHYRPELRDQVEAAVDRNARRRPPGDVIAELDELDEKIRAWLSRSRSRPGQHSRDDRDGGATADGAGIVGTARPPRRRPTT